MWFFPLLATLLASIFAGLVLRLFLERRRPSQALWAGALLMYAGASIALLLGISSSWTTGEYRTFWLLGAVLNVPYLAAGELTLLVNRRWLPSALALVLVFATAFAFNRVRTAGIDPAALDADLPSGSDAFAGDPFVLSLARAYSYEGYVVLVGGARWSAWGMRKAPELRNRFIGTLLIALGATVVAAGSAFAATGNLPAFSSTIAVGIATMFWGFLRASYPVGPLVPDGSTNGSSAASSGRSPRAG
jgi:hypothetical protein